MKINLLHCQKCHHEWFTDIPECKCNWCRSESYVLQEDIKMFGEEALEFLKKMWGLTESENNNNEKE